MNAILELIKTLIPFGIAFLFLWGIGRACCTSNKKNNPNSRVPQRRPSQTSPVRDSRDDDDDQTIFDQKQDIFYTKKDILRSKQEMEAGKRDIFDTAKQDLVSSRPELLSSKQDIMAGKKGVMTAKKSLIREATDDHSAGVDLTLALPQKKKRKLTPIQQSFLLKEILDAPKAIKPYKRKYPR